MISIQTNVNSLVAQQNLSVNTAFQSKTIAQLTSGYRINQSGDDAAGLAVANKFRSTVAELTQGVANGNDATAQLQIMDGGMSNISSILDRLKSLATQSSSGTFTGNRATVNAEFQNDLAEIDRQAQSIGLNTGGSFAKNLDVYLGQGSGSSSLKNGVVTLGLTQSAVDSQSLGMKGMQAVNANVAADGSSTGVSIGATSSTSVQNIVGNSNNQEAIAGYSAFQFSGAGFSDAGKAQVSVNLAGVTDVATLAAALNSAIKAAGDGNTASATAFKSANVVASVHTDSSGGQQLAFSSSTTAFQVQAGDQMANALLGHVTGSGVATLGVAVSGTSATNVSGAITKGGTLTQGQTVKLVVTGGGLAGPVTLNVNTASTTPVTTSGAITDLETQFSGNAQLAAAGLTMTGSSTPGSQLSFKSASGQSFNIQVSGDSANLLGLGSFLADKAGNADYTAITAGAAYSAATLTGSATSTGMAAGLEISLNGQASTALTGIDLTAGAHAVAATATGIAIGTAAVDITAANQLLNITVTNNGVATTKAITLTTTAQVATFGAKASTLGSDATDVIGSPTAITATNGTINISVDGGPAVTLTVAANAGSSKISLAGAIQTAITGSSLSGKVTAGVDANGIITLTSATKGAASSVNVSAGATNDGLAALGFTTTTAFGLADAPTTVASIAATLQTAFGAAAKVTVTNTNQLSIESTTKGANSAVTINAGTANATLGLPAAATAVTTTGTNSTIGDVVDNLNAQFAANGTYQAAGLQAVATKSDGTVDGTASNNTYVSIKSTNETQFRLNSVDGGAVATAGALASTVTSASIATPATNITVAAGSNSFNIAVDGGTATAVTVANATYSNAATFLAAVNAAITAMPALAGNVTAGYDPTSGKLTLTSASTGSASSVTTSANGANTGLANLGFGTGATNSGHQIEVTENTGFGAAGASFTTAAASSTGTAISTLDAFGSSNTGALAFKAMQFGTDKQALTFSAADSNGVLETKTITLENNKSTNRAGVSIDDAVSYINQQLQQSTSNPALQSIVAVKETVGSEEKINFISSLNSFTVGVASTGSGNGVNAGSVTGQATQINSTTNGTGANMSVDTQAGALAAITAIASAVAKLGSAQAAVGKGQNQLTYAITLAQSQITNFSAAESQIRDANVAQQAANLSKAQTLSQASIAAMAQANSAPQAVLSLLRG